MKKNTIYIFLILLLTSCSGYLDRNPLSEHSNATFWTTEKEALAALTGCYNGWHSMTTIIYFDCASDNAYNQWSHEGYQLNASGLASAGDVGQDRFKYANIVRCNTFLANIDRPSMNEDLRKRMKAEVRFLRAYQYFEKVTLYGNVPLITTPLTLEECDLPSTPKNDVIDFIVKELTEASVDLPVSYSGGDVGRITKGAALAYKARMELFVGKFADCAITSKQIMDLNVYELLEDYKNIFKSSHQNSKEVILDVQYEDSGVRTASLVALPPASSGGWSSINPTQALVDAYECSNGLTITDASSGYNPSDPYKNRDPRLAATVICPGDIYNEKRFNSIDADAGDFYTKNNCSKTGYNARKYIDVRKDYSNISKVGINGIVVRYAEILLMYAEAKIELNSIDPTVYDAIDEVRYRAGMPDVVQGTYSSQAKLRELIRRERRSELAMEGIRWFDICRWKIGPEVMNVKVEGALLGTVDAVTGALTLTADRIFVQDRVFDANKHYLWPVPQATRDAAPQIDQNPGY